MTLFTKTGRAYAQAVALARYYLDLNQVQEVWLFGSVANNGDGHDIDLILSVEQELFYAFIDELNRRIVHSPKNISGEKFARWRLEIAQKLIQAPILPPFSEAIDHQVDLFLFPLGWEQNIDRIERLSYALRKRFVRKIRRDALRFDPALGDFISPQR